MARRAILLQRRSSAGFHAPLPFGIGREMLRRPGRKRFLHRGDGEHGESAGNRLGQPRRHRNAAGIRHLELYRTYRPLQMPGDGAGHHHRNLLEGLILRDHLENGLPVLFQSPRLAGGIAEASAFSRAFSR